MPMPQLATGLPVPFLTRSWLVLPAREEAALHAGLRSGADILVIDLTLEKGQPKDLWAGLCALLQARTKGASEPAIFIMLPADGPEIEPALSALMPARPEGIMIAFPASAADVQRLDVLLSVEEAEHGIEAGQTRIAVLADGLDDLDLADKSTRLVAACWSAARLMERLGATRMHDAGGALVDTFRYHRARLLSMAARAHLEAIDSESGLISTERLSRDAREAAADGFSGKITLAPRQAAQINHAFSPGPESVLEAEAVLSDVHAADSAKWLRALRIKARAVLMRERG